MESILKIATEVSTPLMVSGFLAGAFFLILRQILEKNLFPVLTKQLSAEIIKLIIERLFILALIALIFGFMGFVITVFVHTNKIDKTSTTMLQPEDIIKIEKEREKRSRQNTANKKVRASLLNFKKYLDAEIGEYQGNDYSPRVSDLDKSIPKGALSNLNIISNVLDETNGLIPKSIEEKIGKFLNKYSILRSMQELKTIEEIRGTKDSSTSGLNKSLYNQYNKASEELRTIIAKLS
ncbi:hypothetical protein QUF90_24525 [Desulfococcaceae bacterium HSG9]|nr:hypothetical protein [Desulfococcaceae bacterium HSG9]